ncbi:hypothetical protein CP556_04740 [Natrinema sp. CBA1119]|uniref:hypothetical protein n=1 Tax=Natrinema sp. CBA1119 TaxID=1608465 RepID=UPI000BF774CC|nr:hypothetical protein [Natrinema sp. CBA1119]PGF15502.1 hypothetical protein CP556_04740 [Natrinema sp. CBA1119]
MLWRALGRGERSEIERSEISKCERGANARSEHSEDLEKRTANDVSREQRPVSPANRDTNTVRGMSER